MQETLAMEMQSAYFVLSLLAATAGLWYAAPEKELRFLVDGLLGATFQLGGG